MDAAARHRATPVRSNPLQGLSKAVSANAGTIGRQAAVLAAASGVVLTFGLPAQGAPAQDASREALTVDKPTTIALDRVSGSKPIKITATAKKNKVKRDEVSTTSEPRPEPVVEEQPEPAQEEEAPAAETNTQNQTTQAPQQQQATEQARPQQQSQTQVAAASTPKPKAEAKAPAGASGIVASAYAGVGSPYVLGGGTPSGWDCSGFTAWVYAQNGISIPRTTWGIMGSSKFQRVSSPAPGDLVIQNGGGHVVVYVGGGKAIGAQNPSVGTIVQSVNRNPIVGYYRYVG
ncbi:C40 family peptidase [Micrococcoides hystricis]|uniref:C40 family peptidase n=1 Tax=Micrococcoides hystricis TaxID=1572761 RepID=A0ABV6P9N4_9MICC